MLWHDLARPLFPPGYTRATMYLRDVQEADAGTYWCVVSSYDRVFKKEMQVMLTEAVTAEVELVSQSSDEVRFQSVFARIHVCQKGANIMYIYQ